MLKSTLLLASLLPLITSLNLPKPTPTHFLSHPLTPFLAQAASDNGTAAILCKSVTMTNVTQDERTHSDSIRASVRSLRNGNPLVDFIEGPDSSDKFTSEYIKPLGYVAAPWFALLGVSVITFLVLLLNCCCTFGCGSSSPTSKPVSKASKFKKCLVITSIITALGLIAFCIYGINVSSDFTKGGNQTMCQAGILVDQLVEGSDGDHWVGLRSMVNKLLVTINNFDSTGISLNYATGATDIALINTKYTTDTQSLTVMYNNNKASTVNRPDPTIGGTYQPDYINNLGPSSTATTQTGKILTEMQNKKTIVTQASQDITTSIAQIKAGVVITIQTLQDAEQTAQNAAYSVNNMTVEVQSGGSDAQDFIRGFGKGLFALFLSEILTSAAAIVSMGFAIFGILALNKLLHCSWCLISIFMIAGWVLAAILFPLSVVLVESCEVGEKVITNQTFFNQTFDKFLSDPNYTQSRDMLYTCLYGDGDVLTTLGIRSTLSVFETLFDALDNTANLTESIQPVPDSYEIPSQLAQVAQLQVGYVSDASETDTDLTTLNSLTNSKTNTCTKVQDLWILNSANCTAASGSVFASSSAANFNLYNPTCIGYDAWGSKAVNQRYNTDSFPQPSCGSIAGNTEDVALGNLVNGFVTARGQVNNVFKSVKTDLGTVQTANADYMTAIKGATSNIAPVRDQSKAIYQALGDNDEGIFKNSDCRFIKESIETLHDVMCVRFVSGAYETSIALSVISFIAIFGVSILFCLAKRNSREIDANDHGNKEDYFRVQAQ